MRDVIIYPSSWYYNACVQGFLEVIAWGLGEKGNEIIEEKILQDDGTAVIPGELMKAVFSTRELKVPDGYTFEEVPDDICELKRIGWWWVEKSSLINWRNFDTDKIDDEILLLIFENYLQGKGLKPIAEILNNAGYQTLDNKKWKEEDVGKVVSTETNYNRIPQKHTAIIEFVFRQLFSNNKIYQNLYNLNSHKEKIKFLNKWFSVNGKGDYYCSFCNSSLDIIFDKNINSQFLTLEISKLFGNSINEFPNSFWDNSPQYLMCRCCRSYFIFFHIIQH
ncbi:MAG: recombinase family protein, partial [Syntrophomonadaceae bacterium]